MPTPSIQLYHGDNRVVLPRILNDSVDSIITDPPYELGFMGKGWDKSGITYDPFVWQECLRVLKPGGFLLAFGGARTYHRLGCAIENSGFEIRDQLMWLYGSGLPKTSTALKPSHEPIALARKPFKGSLINNVSTNGTGQLNVDRCRTSQGRWAANVLHDGSEEVARLFPYSKDGFSVNRNRNGERHSGNKILGAKNASTKDIGYGGEGSAARFFYCAKANKKDRGVGNTHVSVKPCDLMRYLCRLVTPPSGIILDPFMGSGSTGKAAKLEGFKFIGIELEDTEEHPYFSIAKRRIYEVIQRSK